MMTPQQMMAQHWAAQTMLRTSADNSAGCPSNGSFGSGSGHSSWDHRQQGSQNLGDSGKTGSRFAQRGRGRGSSQHANSNASYASYGGSASGGAGSGGAGSGGGMRGSSGETANTKELTPVELDQQKQLWALAQAKQGHEKQEQEKQEQEKHEEEQERVRLKRKREKKEKKAPKTEKPQNEQQKAQKTEKAPMAEGQ
jgi:hypothetical protein